MPVAAAANILELNYTTIAECTAQLVSVGALEKTKSEDDSRCALITTTKAGEHLMDTLDRCLVSVAKDALAPLEGERRVQGLRLFYEVCVRLGKKRMAGNLVRGDSVFIITCQQIAVEFGHLCRQYRLNEIQGHTLLAIGQSECASMKALRKKLCLDAPTLSRAVSRLVERGFAKRVEGASRRETNVALTASGLQCASSLAEETDSMLARLFADDYGSAVFRRTVSALRASLEEYARRP
ncbi:MarR family winged helix-turn-helix transcriptional regulator [Adlercreutzia shanghongiae]|uniref:MarR family transcriptional regulator n=1 Tax=Adlercreutzia shanghongiae TaxID=3111773 RepID=A0ABU6IXS8_9ACTN|nr:MarR family transcriptional regulator [Adlercreutzia sp. R22]MEC4294648.1 MarR family transcriptional regulator [Adlercreutzia sp. R22]